MPRERVVDGVYDLGRERLCAHSRVYGSEMWTWSSMWS
jgi:hypothetical protein